MMESDGVVFLDEAGCNTSMARTHGRSLSGERSIGKKPAAKGKNITIMGALGFAGMVAVGAMLGSMTKPDFVTFLRDTLFPRMRRGQTLVMDNLRAHHSKEVRELAALHGIYLVFVPAYSPDMNPIEHAWSKIKGLLRSTAARTTKAVLNAIDVASELVTSSDFLGWSRHCGYPF